MRVSRGLAIIVTGIATAIGQVIAQVVEPDDNWETNPVFALLGGLIVPGYLMNVLTKSRMPIRNPGKVVRIAVVVFLVPVMLIIALGGRDTGFKVQMITQFAVLGLGCFVLVPPALAAERTSSPD